MCWDSVLVYEMSWRNWEWSKGETMDTVSIIIIVAGVVLLVVFLLFWKLADKHSKGQRLLERDITEDCDVTVVVVKGRQSYLLLVDDKNQRLIRCPLLPGITAVAIGVAKQLPNGSLAINARNVDEFNEEDFEVDIKHNLH